MASRKQSTTMSTAVRTIAMPRERWQSAVANLAIVLTQMELGLADAQDNTSRSTDTDANHQPTAAAALRFTHADLNR